VVEKPQPKTASRAKKAVPAPPVAEPATRAKKTTPPRPKTAAAAAEPVAPAKQPTKGSKKA
jgi:hypothetical protein